MTDRPGRAPAVQLDPDAALALVDSGQAWLLACPYRTDLVPCCTMQGGVEGLAAHIRTVHPERVTA